MRNQKLLLLFLVPGLIAVIVFNYLPMVGILMAFEDYQPKLGFFGSPVVGFTHFESTARFDAANAMFADDDAAFEAAWSELMSDFREKGGYDAAIEELAEVFERIHQQ